MNEYTPPKVMIVGQGFGFWVAEVSEAVDCECAGGCSHTAVLVNDETPMCLPCWRSGCVGPSQYGHLWDAGCVVVAGIHRGDRLPVVTISPVGRHSRLGWTFES